MYRYHSEKEIIPGGDVDKYLRYETAKENLSLLLLNKHSYAELLKTIPHCDSTPLEDMSIAFQLITKNDSTDAIDSVIITNSMIDYWQVDKEIMLLDAIENTFKLNKASIIPIDKTDKSKLMDILKKEQIKTAYILTNTIKCNGTVCILNENILKRLDKLFNGDFMLYPLNKDEFLIVKDTKEVLYSIVSQCKIGIKENGHFSNRIYHYKNGKFILLPPYSDKPLSSEEIKKIL